MVDVIISRQTSLQLGRISWFPCLLLAIASSLSLLMLYVVIGQTSLEQLPAYIQQLGVDKLESYTAILAIIVPSIFVVLGLFDLAASPASKRKNNPSQSMIMTKTGASTIPLTNRNSVVSNPSEVMDFNFGLLRKMEWHRFEIVCAEYLRGMGYEVLEVGFGERHGVDLEVFLPGKTSLFNVVRCVVSEKRVAESLIKEFIKSMQSRNVNEGMVFSVRGFDDKAKKLAEGYRIALVDGETLCSRVRSLNLELRNALLQVALDGDYTTPTCANCGIRLVLRRKTGRHATDEFWGCINHPVCKTHIPIHGE